MKKKDSNEHGPNPVHGERLIEIEFVVVGCAFVICPKPRSRGKVYGFSRVFLQLSFVVLRSVVKFGLFERFDGVLISVSFLGYVVIWFSEVKNELDNSRMNLILRTVSFGAPRPHMRRLRHRVGNRP